MAMGRTANLRRLLIQPQQKKVIENQKEKKILKVSHWGIYRCKNDVTYIFSGFDVLLQNLTSLFSKNKLIKNNTSRWEKNIVISSNFMLGILFFSLHALA